MCLCEKPVHLSEMIASYHAIVNGLHKQMGPGPAYHQNVMTDPFAVPRRPRGAPPRLPAPVINMAPNEAHGVTTV